jgi:hypothetical protein
MCVIVYRVFRELDYWCDDEDTLFLAVYYLCVFGVLYFYFIVRKIIKVECIVRVYDKGGTAGGCVSCLYVYNQFQVEKK